MKQTVQAMSDLDVLAVMVGRKTATMMYEGVGGQLEKLLGECQPGASRHAWASTKLHAAKELVRRSLCESMRHRDALSSPRAVQDYLRVTFLGRGHEVFVAVFLDAQHRVITAEEMFRGTLTQTSVYPREVVKRSLFNNAAAVIFAHNHPSGVCEPSQADELLTRSLRSALALVDVQVLDHFIVAGGASMSFAERGLL